MIKQKEFLNLNLNQKKILLNRKNNVRKKVLNQIEKLTLLMQQNKRKVKMGKNRKRE